MSGRKLIAATAISIALVLGFALWLGLETPDRAVPESPRDARDGTAALAVENVSTIEPAGASLREAPEEIASSVEAPVEESKSIRGVVRSIKGAPIAGAEIATRDPPRSVASGDDGRFEIDALPEGFYELEVRARGYGTLRLARTPTRDDALEIVLVPEIVLRGRVVDVEEKPIDGATITVTRLGADTGDALEREPVARAPVAMESSDANGRFAVGGLARGAYRVAIERPGWIRLVASVVSNEELASAEREQVFQLESGHVIRGVARGLKGKASEPLAGALVEVTARGSVSAPVRRLARHRARTRTDAGGVFEFMSLPAGKYRLVASAPLHRDVARPNLETDGEDLELELEAVPPLEGLVVDLDSGDAVPDAEVRIDNFEDHKASRTDDDGRFRIDGFLSAHGSLRVNADGYLPFREDVTERDAGASFTVELERGGRVAGRVFEGSKPVAGIRVGLVRAKSVEARFDDSEIADLADPDGLFAVDDSGSRPPPRGLRHAGKQTRTDAEGRFELPIREARSYRVVVEGKPYVSAWSRVITVADPRDEIDGVDVAVERAATLRGLVVDQGARPVAGARLVAAPFDSLDRIDRYSTLADATGAFEIDTLPAGEYVVVATAAEFITARTDAIAVASGGTSVVEVEMEPEMAIAGSVSTPEGDPIESARIRASVRGEARNEYWSAERALSDAFGRFWLGRLANRRYDVRVAADEHASTLVEDVAAGERGVHVRLERLVSLSGRVLGEYAGEPVAGRMRLKYEGDAVLSDAEYEYVGQWRNFGAKPSSPISLGTPLFDSVDGRFSIEKLPPGLYAAEFDAPGHLSIDPIELELEVDEGLRDVQVRLPEVGAITGEILDGNGRGISGVTVEALRASVDETTGRVSHEPLPKKKGDASSPGETKSSGDGGFALTGLPDGSYLLRFMHDDYIPREQGDYLFADGTGGVATLGLRVFLPSGATLRGRLRGLDAVERGSINVSLRPARGVPDSREQRLAGPKGGRVDDAGLFEIRGLAVGKYTLELSYRRAEDGRRARRRRWIEIHAPDRERGVTIDLSRR